MTGMLGIALVIISLVAGGNEWHYWLSIILLSMVGVVGKYWFIFGKTKSTKIFFRTFFNMECSPIFILWVLFFGFSRALLLQGFIWSIFYLIGTLFR